MKTYISILRGINVSGKNIIKMDALKKLYQDLDFKNVSTYVQSGNVVFSSKLNDPKKIERLLTSQIEQEFGLVVPVIVMTIQELKDYIQNNPFQNDKDETFIHFTFLANQPDNYKKENINNKKAENEEIVIKEKVVYLYCPNGYGRTKLTNTLLENTLKVTATTRNFKTTNKLLDIAEQIK